MRGVATDSYVEPSTKKIPHNQVAILSTRALFTFIGRQDLLFTFRPNASLQSQNAHSTPTADAKPRRLNIQLHFFELKRYQPWAARESNKRRKRSPSPSKLHLTISFHDRTCSADSNNYCLDDWMLPSSSLAFLASTDHRRIRSCVIAASYLFHQRSHSHLLRRRSIDREP